MIQTLTHNWNTDRLPARVTQIVNVFNLHGSTGEIRPSRWPLHAGHCVLKPILYRVRMFENVKANLAAAAEKLAHLRRFL